MIKIKKIVVEARANFITNGDLIPKGSVFEVDPLFLIGRSHLVQEIPQTQAPPIKPTNIQASQGPTETKEEFLCPDCNKVFASEKALRGHSKVHKADKNEEG